MQAVQTDSATEDCGVNTDADWESQVAAMLEYSSSLTEQYDALMKQQDEEGVAHEKHKQQVQKRKEEATRQHQVGPCDGTLQSCCCGPLTEVYSTIPL